MDYSYDYYLDQADARSSDTALIPDQMAIVEAYFTTGPGSTIIANLNDVTDYPSAVAGKTILAGTVMELRR
jgi:hypothetical protein